MKILVAAVVISGALIMAAKAQADDEPAGPAARAEASAAADWKSWTRPLGDGRAVPAVARSPEVAASLAFEADEEIDVVDAHWMALTMWGEGRGQGEEGMRAVGHVIRNRQQAKRNGAFVTDTVSAAWQFSCWNEGDPNRAAMLNVETLPETSRDHRLWLAAKRIAAEILAGRSADPTGGALFYHTVDVQPRWSEGVAPVAQIGTHLFFRAAR
jgi:spore germination cell wall hydrolase CwlJ-like protein